MIAGGKFVITENLASSTDHDLVNPTKVITENVIKGDINT